MPFEKQTEVKVVVGPLDLDLELGLMPPDEIKLWELNPRIKHLVGLDGSFPSEADLMAAIQNGQPASYKKLRQDIERFGQQEPVFLRVVKGARTASATVIEGNTRVAIIKALHERDPHDERWQSVMAYRLPDGFSDPDMAVLTANYHVKGQLRNQWTRYQIGAFIHEEVAINRHFNQSELADKIGKSPSWVNRHLTIYKFAEEFRDEIEAAGANKAEAEKETNDKFSLLEEAWKVKKFRDQIDEDPEARATLFRWIHQDKFQDHRAIRQIYEDYNDPVKRQKMEDGGPGIGDEILRAMGKSVPLHDDLDRLLKRIEAVQIGDLPSIKASKVAEVREALTNLEKMLAPNPSAS